ncbi:MAG: phospholipase A [Desulfobacteraceae bacterium]|nr:phospholipase A [Desulfobacteraceae bacterium]
MKICLPLLFWLLIIAIQNPALGADAEPPGATPAEARITSPSVPEGTPNAAESKSGDPKTDLSEFISTYQPYAKNISFYQPMYFLVGTDPKNSKFQVSFKYRFIDPAKSWSQHHPWLQGIHLAYTQTSFWDLASASKPFEDTSYKPELFWQSQNMDTSLAWLKGFFVQTGLQHESNGRAGEESRSTNFAYIEPSFVLMNEKKLTGLKISPRFHLFVGNDGETNPDLPDYRGYWDLRLTFGRADRFIIDSRMHWANAGGSFQVDITYPLHRLFGDNLDLYLQAEYVNALAESLLNYNERTEAVRIGLAIVR